MSKLGKKGKAEKEEKADRVKASAESPVSNEAEESKSEVIDCKPKKIVCCRCGHFCKKEGHGFCPVKKNWRARKADVCESYSSTRS